MFNMLAELAQAFNEEQLDFLFKKFESSAAQCDADNKQGMLLLFRLAKVDTQVSFAQLAHMTYAKGQMMLQCQSLCFCSDLAISACCTIRPNVPG